MPLSFLLLAAALPAANASMDFEALDQAIERCDRAIALPLFAAEPQRRSAFLTLVYQEQSQIAAERQAVAEKRRSLREAALRTSKAGGSPANAGDADQGLVLMQLALDDRQNELDARRRLETLRQQAVDVKRSYFLSHCSSEKTKR